MSTDVDMDLAAAHKHFSVTCFNGTWELLDKSERTADEDQQMIACAMASLWHWMQREDCSVTNLSIGYWMASRVQATVGNAAEARRYGQLCEQVSRAEGVGPFFLAYAFEALARAETLAGKREAAGQWLNEARRLAETVTDEDGRKQLLADLDNIG